MNKRTLDVLYRYGLALLAAASLLLLRWLVGPVVHDALPLITLFGCVALAAWYGGYGPGVLVCVLGYLAAREAPISSYTGARLATPAALPDLAVYALCCLLIIGLAGGLRTAQRASAQRQQRLEQEIEERKRSERALAEMQERFRAFMDHSPARAWIKDHEGRYVFMNRTAEKAIGRTREEWLGHTDFELFPHDIAEQLNEHDLSVRQTGQAAQFVEAILQHGEERFLLSVKFLIPWGEGAVHTAGKAIDVTEHVRAEQALRQADRRKDEFLAILAHELRNPLSPIRSAAAILEEKNLPEPALQRARDIIARQVRQMTRLLDDLLDVSRITLNRLSLDKTVVDVATVIESALETARPAIDAGRHVCTVTLPETPMYVNADPTRLAQVFSNLLSNAAKYSDEGGSVSCMVRRDGDEVLVTIRDRGIGIAPEDLPHLFEMFMQAEPALQRAHGGLGIGLALARRLLALHGGSIEAFSEGLGKGSEFIVRLPAAQSAALQPAAQHPAAVRVVAHRILVVDDNEDSAASLGLLLTLRGHEVRTAGDGLRAVAEAEAFRPDLVLLDIGLPNLNGYDTARAIRRRSWGKQIVLVAVTGWGTEEDKLRAKDAGFDHHLTKPADPSALDAILARMG
jgi:PAS domain S-box-containing protein